MIAKRTILILTDWFLPGYLAGGPIQSIATLTQQLSNEFDFKIITTDRDFKSDEKYESIVTNVWTVHEGRQVFYISPSHLIPDFMLQLIQKTPHDVLYINSLFSKYFAVLPLKWKQQEKIKAPIVLAPRGMLGDGALAIKPFKKQVFLMYANLFGLFKNIHWQSTSGQETYEIKKRIGERSHISEVSNLPHAFHQSQKIEKREGKLRLCFISRISVKKNLNFAIDILKQISDKEIVFDVYGPIEDEAYWQVCMLNATALPSNISFQYEGILKPTEIAKTISQYHALFLPTQNENYGHIIVETLQQGRLVILSDQTPWRHLENEHIGFDIALNDTQQFVKAIEKLLAIDQEAFNEMSMSALAFIDSHLNVEEIKGKYVEMFGFS